MKKEKRKNLASVNKTTPRRDANEFCASASVAISQTVKYLDIIFRASLFVYRSQQIPLNREPLTNNHSHLPCAPYILSPLFHTILTAKYSKNVHVSEIISPSNITGIDSVPK